MKKVKVHRGKEDDHGQSPAYPFEDKAQADKQRDKQVDKSQSDEPTCNSWHALRSFLSVLAGQPVAAPA
jgi:hypothetical protein